MDSDKKRYSRGIDNVEHGENEKLITCRICYDATSVASERLFSKAGNIITDHRSRLNQRRLEKLVFLSSIESKFWDI
ncbi:zinc finger BED domain-containing protein 4-like [Aphis craccivora]|uniref:Zinc finger BED domain-containing protein 4-like n=1 Tax=Aphis craccivora TaxID=307492 RepID=A0A6G0YSL7_APHCR|nr:zinc finger BED domain-containing protein 4-like [Aphis craccivora]